MPSEAFRRAGRELARALAEAALAFSALFLFLDGWHRDFRAPLSFSYDALEYLMQVKGTLENGWWWVHPRLSAPGVFEQIQYPSNSNVDQAIVWIVRLFTTDVGLSINVTWMIMVVLSALIASRCLATLGVARRIAVPTGLLFALSPYALLRNIDHFSLAIYLVPIACTVALLVASDRLQSLAVGRVAFLLVGCVLIGLNYVYYAFFACFVILAASLIAYASSLDLRRLGRGLVFVAAICLATAVNLAPSWYVWARDGKPVTIPEKHAAEAEQYGLKIRQLVSPVVNHSLAPFRRWSTLETNAQFPLENENRNSRLGVVATIGFLTLLAGFFVPRISTAAGDGSLFVAASRLTLAALLLATIGGFGSLFSLLVSSEIRAYDRITPFISFFSFTAIALLCQEALRTTTSVSPRWIAAALMGVFAVGLADQGQAAKSLNEDREPIRQEWTALDAFVHSVEDRLPEGAMVFELPVLIYQNETGREKMLPNDQIKPYLVSRHLRWSFPALSERIVRWQQQVGRLPVAALATALSNQGFTAILVDRNGYPDTGAALLREIGALGPAGAVIALNDRYAAVDIRGLPKVDVAGERLPQLGDAYISSTAGLPKCNSSTSFNIEWIADNAGPFSRAPVTIGHSGEFTVGGWALDDRHHTVAADVDIAIGGRIYPALYGIDRVDVAKYYARPEYRASGFAARLAGADVGSSGNALSIRILSSDRSCYYEGPPISVVSQ